MLFPLSTDASNTSVALIIAVTWLPFRRFSRSTELLVMTEAICRRSLEHHVAAHRKVAPPDQLQAAVARPRPRVPLPTD
jgi:hypothetical protein